ncbi:MAG: sigma-70 family RNA polymerase sigma factor [Ktedonobacteraceae bacterium]
MDQMTLYQHYYSAIYRQVRSRVSQHEQAEDLTHDTFVKALRALDRAPETPDGLRRWLGCIARNTVLDYRKHTRCIAWSELDENSAVTTSDLPEIIALRMEVQAVLRSLPAHSCHVLLASMKGYTSSEMATRLGISPNLAKMRLSRARQQFKQRYLALQEREVNRG